MSKISVSHPLAAHVLNYEMNESLLDWISDGDDHTKDEVTRSEAEESDFDMGNNSRRDFFVFFNEDGTNFLKQVAFPLSLGPEDYS